MHIEISEHIDATPQQVLQCYRERSFYEARYRDSDIESYVIDALDANGPRVQLTLYLGLNTHYLPSIIKRKLGQRQSLGYAIHWDVTAEGQRQAVFRYQIEGLPVKVFGKIDMIPCSLGLEFVVNAEVICTKAMFARLIEPLIATRAEKEIRADIMAIKYRLEQRQAGATASPNTFSD